jgi:hypothetical protein
LDAYEPLKEYLEIYETSEDGRRVYNDCLEATNNYFPQYLIELKGIATGADVPFHKVNEKNMCLIIITINCIMIDIFIAFPHSFGRHTNLEYSGYEYRVFYLNGKHTMRGTGKYGQLLHAIMTV